MTDLLIMMAALVAAFFWIWFQEHQIRKLSAQLAKAENERDLASKHAELHATENEFFKTVLLDVAKGEAHVWIGENGELIATRTAAGEAPLH